jgi:hypothetical protein
MTSIIVGMKSMLSNFVTSHRTIYSLGILHYSLSRYSVALFLCRTGGNVDVSCHSFYPCKNRRKSRVGLALENHLELLFIECGIQYKRTAVTENKAKPDFIFPSAKAYHDPAFNPLRLTMLGVKSTCKDRWRQVLAEADRIEHKHLLTLETSISRHQTDEMRAKNLQLILPRGLHGTYTPEQQAWLMDIASFTELVRGRQDAA